MTKFQCFRLNIGDEETYGIDRQFLWGDALLITPVLTQVINNFLNLDTIKVCCNNSQIGLKKDL